MMVTQRLLSALTLPLLLLLFAGHEPRSAVMALDQLTVCPPSVGCVKGVHLKGYQSERFEAYMGIPYALPPLGELRFSVSFLPPRKIWISSYLPSHPEPQGYAQAAGSVQCHRAQDGLHSEELSAAHSGDLWGRGLPLPECLQARGESLGFPAISPSSLFPFRCGNPCFPCWFTSMVAVSLAAQQVLGLQDPSTSWTRAR